MLVCDFCVVVTPEYIGKSTSNRIRQAISMNKPVYVWKDNGLNGIIRNEEDLKKYIEREGGYGRETKVKSGPQGRNSIT